MRIKKEEYEEYLQLKKWARKLDIRNSAKKVANLEDDIDEPIKRCVALFALLGCQPLYSCCGFDYDGQPLHKSHQYGNPYIKLTANMKSLGFVSKMTQVNTLWSCKTGRGIIDVQHVVKGNPHWRSEECIHFSEECIIAIAQLEAILIYLEGSMDAEVVLYDTNEIAKRQNKNWQYPPKKEWVIKKSDWLPKSD